MGGAEGKVRLQRANVEQSAKMGAQRRVGGRIWPLKTLAEAFLRPEKRRGGIFPHPRFKLAWVYPCPDLRKDRTRFWGKIVTLAFP